MHFLVSLLNLRPGLIGGTETYIRRTLAEFHHHLGGDRVSLLAIDEVARTLKFEGLDVISLPMTQHEIVRARILEAASPYRARSIEQAIERSGADVLFFPQQTIFPKVVRQPSVMTVVDIQYLIHPRNVPFAERWFRRIAYPSSLRRADHIICISEYSRTTIHDWYHVNPAKTSTILLGTSPINPADFPPHELAATTPYIYYPANSYPHKNHEVLLRSVAVLKARGRFPYKLVLTGQRTPLWPSLANLIETLGLKNDVKHLGYVSYDEVRRLYHGAQAVVFPTRFEGFGLPVVEAAEFDRKIIVSRLPVFDEIGVPPDWQIDFADPDALGRALTQPGPTRLTVTPLTWSETARLTLEALRKQGEGQ